LDWFMVRVLTVDPSAFVRTVVSIRASAAPAFADPPVPFLFSIVLGAIWMDFLVMEDRNNQPPHPFLPRLRPNSPI